MADPNTPEGKLQTLAAQIAGLNLELLIHPVQAATYNFEPQRHLFESILSFYTDIATARLSYIPDAALTTMYNLAGNVFNALSSINNFNVRQGDPNQNYNSNVSQLLNQWQQAYNFTISHIAYAKVSSSAIAQELQAVKATVNEIRSAWDKASIEHKNQSETIAKQFADRTAEFEKVMAAAREASSKSAVSRQAGEFESEAKKCLVASRWWFAGTILIVALSLVAVYFMFLKDLHKPLTTAVAHPATTDQQSIATKSDELSIPNHTVTAEVLQQTIARILIVTLLYSAVVWTARNYFASRHNYTVNRHRRNAMQTFRAFVEGTEDKATQDFILRQAAACAFTPQQTGYLKDESLPTPAPSSPIIDIIRPGSS
jgi:hypothetical protein